MSANPTPPRRERRYVPPTSAEIDAAAAALGDHVGECHRCLACPDPTSCAVRGGCIHLDRHCLIGQAFKVELAKALAAPGGAAA